MQNKTKGIHSILIKFIIIFVIYGIVSQTLNAAYTYAVQTRTYHQKCEDTLKEITNYLNALITTDGEEFLELKNYFDENHYRMLIPIEYDGNYSAAYKEFARLFARDYPDKTFKSDISFDELNDEVKNAYAVYKFEYWLYVFEKTRDDFGLKYTYFIYPKEEPYMVYMFDATRDPVEIDGKQYINLAFGGEEDPAKYPMMWEAWHTGENPSDFDVFNNEYGHTYAYYSPVWIGDEQVGLVCADILVDNVNADILQAVEIQTGGAFIVLLIGILIIIALLRKMFIARIIKLERKVALYKNDKDVTVADQLEKMDTGRDEISALYDQFGEMIIELKDYMNDLQKVTAEKERIGAELNVATQIQADMLPSIFPPFPNKKNVDIYATMDPAKEVGGDFYDFFLVDDDHLALVMADVSGKGVPAALFMVISKTLIKNRAQFSSSPAEILSDVNDQLCTGNEAGLFVTVWLAIIDLRTGKGIAANAGHEHPTICRNGGQYELVKYRHSPACATMEGIPFKEHEFQIYPGDSIYVYTDGVPEATNKDDELFGEERMIEALNKDPQADPVTLLANVKNAMDEFVGDSMQFDDITMLCFKYFGPEEPSAENE